MDAREALTSSHLTHLTVCWRLASMKTIAFRELLIEYSSGPPKSSLPLSAGHKVAC